MLLNVLELVMLILCVLARIAGTVAIIWLIVTKVSDDFFKFALISFTVFVGLGFSVHYDNPANQSAPSVVEHPQ